MSNSVNFVLSMSRIWILLLLLAPTTLYGAGRHATAPDPLALRADGQLEFLCPDRPVGATIRIEIADSPATRAKGLMGRLLKDDAEGMLFIFETPASQNFWMRNTPGSLDIIFVAEDGRVLNIAEQTLPLSDRTYSSNGPASFVVEVRGGFARRFDIEQRCRIRWQRY
jgi:uncharacterized membrane protein (UPF0127 family)